MYIVIVLLKMNSLIKYFKRESMRLTPQWAGY